MSYKILEDEATADVAFEATGKTLDELFESLFLVTNSIMADLNKIRHKTKREFSLKEKTLEKLVFNFIDEIIFLKPAAPGLEILFAGPHDYAGFGHLQKSIYASHEGIILHLADPAFRGICYTLIVLNIGHAASDTHLIKPSSELFLYLRLPAPGHALPGRVPESQGLSGPPGGSQYRLPGLHVRTRRVRPLPRPPRQRPAAQAP